MHKRTCQSHTRDAYWLSDMKEYVGSKDGAHLIHVSDKMVEGMAAAKGKNDEKILQQELAAQSLRKVKEKDKEKKRRDQGSSKIKGNLTVERTVF